MLRKLKLLDAAILESLRLLPPAYLVGRCTNQPVSFPDFKVPAGKLLLNPIIAKSYFTPITTLNIYILWPVKRVLVHDHCKQDPSYSRFCAGQLKGWLICWTSRNTNLKCGACSIDVENFCTIAGTTLLISPYLLHRDSEKWPQSQEFRPQRWLPHLTSNKPAGYMSLLSGLGPNKSYMPFGAGPR